MATAAPERAPTATTTHKWVWLFREGNGTQRDLLGGKGAGLAEMTNAGMPVPPGFTITTEACIEYYRNGRQFPAGMWEQAMECLRDVEQAQGKIEPFAKELLKLKAERHPETISAPEILLVLCDRTTKYGTLRKVLMNAAEAGFPKYRLAVLAD